MLQSKKKTQKKLIASEKLACLCLGQYAQNIKMKVTALLLLIFKTTGMNRKTDCFLIAINNITQGHLDLAKVEQSALKLLHNSMLVANCATAEKKI